MRDKEKSTMTDLVDELKKLRQTPAIKFMIKEAKAGDYHDYKNTKYICGKVEAARKLRRLGHIGLARRIESGEFDETADEQDKAMMREDLGYDSQLLDILGLGESK